MWSIPNLITFVRILMTPFIVIKLSHGEYLAGGWMFGGAALTDILDGGLARKWGSQSRFGQYLDPIADKILLSCMYIGLAMGKAAPWWLVIVIFARDLWILVLSAIALRFTKFRDLRPSVWGKASTFAQIMAAVAITGIHAYGGEVFVRGAQFFIAAVAILAVISGVDYTLRGLFYFRGRQAEIAHARAANRR